MKKVLLYTVLITFAALSCRKEDNPHLEGVAAVPLPQLTKDATADQAISGGDPISFNGKILVDLYFKDGEKPSKIDLVVIKNNDVTHVKVVQADIALFPTTVEITGAQIQTLFSDSIRVGDNYDFGADITTTSGIKYEAFPAVGKAYGSGISSLAGLSTTVRYSSVCQYDPEVYQGNFVVVQDDWADYQVGDIVPITKVDDTHFSFKYLADDAQPIIVAVDPITNTTSVTKQVYGSGYGGDTWPYGPLSAQSVANSADNYVAPCDETFSIRLEHTVSAGSFGEATIVMKRSE